MLPSKLSKSLFIYVIIHSSFKFTNSADDESKGKKEPSEEGSSGIKMVDEGKFGNELHVQVDIKSRQTTESLLYLKDYEHECEVYHAKFGFLINSVIQNRHIPRHGLIRIWNTDERQHFVEKVILTGAGSGKKHLALRHVSKNKTHFTKSGKLSPWLYTVMTRKSSVLPEDEHPISITILTLDKENQVKINKNDYSEYIVRKYGKVYHYTFGKNSRCVGVFYECLYMWKFNEEDQEKRYLRDMYFDELDINFTFNFCSSRYIQTYGCDWISKTGDKVKKLTDSDFKFIGINESDTEYVLNCDYDYEEVQVDSVVRCIFKTGVRCVELKYENSTVWKKSEHIETGFPRAFYFHTHMKVFVVEISESLSFLHTYVDGLWNFDSPIETDKFSEEKLKIFNKRGDEESINDETQYEKLKFGPTLCFNFRHKSDLIEIKYEEKTVFEYSNSDNEINNYLLEICFLSDPYKRLVWGNKFCYYIYPEGNSETEYRSQLLESVCEEDLAGLVPEPLDIQDENIPEIV